jgi:alanine dehydrogenase
MKWMTISLGRQDVEQLLTLDTAGADMPHKRELFPGVHARADRRVADVTNQALVTGEIAGAVAEDAISESTLSATLGEIVAGQKRGREDDGEITVFKSTGVTIQDVATAKLGCDLARERGVGREASIIPWPQDNDSTRRVFP